MKAVLYALPSAYVPDYIDAIHACSFMVNGLVGLVDRGDFLVGETAHCLNVSYEIWPDIIPNGDTELDCQIEFNAYLVRRAMERNYGLIVLWDGDNIPMASLITYAKRYLQHVFVYKVRKYVPNKV